MDSTPLIEQPQLSSNSNDAGKNMLIMVLIAVLILSLLGINIFIIMGNAIQHFINIFNPIVSKALSDLGYASGTVLEKTSNIAADASKTGIDILNGTMHSVSDLLIEASKDWGRLDINQPPMMAPNPPKPAETTNPINTPSINNNKWCLVGEYEGKRGCISVSDEYKCLSGQVFPNQQMCLNPNLTQNAS